MSDQPIDPNAAPAPVEANTVKNLSGFNEGEKLADGSVVKADYDSNGTLIGWHKEAATEGAI